MDVFLKKEWTFEMMTLPLCIENENYEIKKYVIIMSIREKRPLSNE
jgi:hypothetical protein